MCVVCVVCVVCVCVVCVCVCVVCVCVGKCACAIEVEVRQAVEKVWEALEMIAPGQYRRRVIQGVFKNLCKLILAGKLPYGVVLGYLAQSGCDIDVHEHTVGDRKVLFALPRGVELQSVAATGGNKVRAVRGQGTEQLYLDTAWGFNPLHSSVQGSVPSCRHCWHAEPVPEAEGVAGPRGGPPRHQRGRGCALAQQERSGVEGVACVDNRRPSVRQHAVLPQHGNHGLR